MIARGSQDSLISGLPGELRLRFDGDRFDTGTAAARTDHQALPAALAGRSRKVGDVLAIASTDPPADLAAVLAAGCSPTSVDVRKPDLDDLYRALALEVSDAA